MQLRMDARKWQVKDQGCLILCLCVVVRAEGQKKVCSVWHATVQEESAETNPAFGYSDPTKTGHAGLFKTLLSWYTDFFKLFSFVFIVIYGV